VNTAEVPAQVQKLLNEIMPPNSPSSSKKSDMACSLTSTSRVRAVIFDLGGVLITSPLKALEEFESENDIPVGYLNFAMSALPLENPLKLLLICGTDPQLVRMHGLNWRPAS
jgi:hypothetical protein